MTGDDFDESDYEREGVEEEEYQETGEDTNVLRRKQEIVFCPRDGEYMPYHVKGALVLRRCPKCGFEKESG